jgi:uncharacterized protein
VTGRPPRRPLRLGRASSDEYDPLPLSPVVREATKRARETLDREARRHGMSRREFLGTASASAVVLAALAACARESGQATGTTAAGTYSVPSETAVDTEAATSALGPGTTEAAGPATAAVATGAVMDVQLHFLDPASNGGGFGQGFPQAACGAADSRDCFDQETFLRLVFDESETAVGVLSALPIADEDGPLSLSVMERALESFQASGRTGRLLLQGGVFPAEIPLTAALEGMAAAVERAPIAAWKTYTHAPGAYRLDDPTGVAVAQEAVRLGVPIISVHKGIGPAAASPADVGPAAAAVPGAVFVVYHSGWQPGVPEGPRATGDAAVDGIDRLLASLEANGIGPDGNVYAELGSTWFNLARDPDQAAHALGKLLVVLGPDRILWGTDSIWYGSPQGQIDAFRAFEIPPEAQERFGYPALTPAVKDAILGGNARRLYALS